MNERIKQLAEQTGILKEQSVKAKIVKNEDGTWTSILEYPDLEKFAQLIVRECAQVLETNGDNQRTIRMTESTGHDKTTDWMEGYEEAVKQYGGFLLKKNAKQIMKHFGVE
jgi:uncharacterized membrane protein